MKKRVLIWLIIFALLAFIIILLSPKWYLLHQKTTIKPSYRKELANLGAKAITSLDVPVGAIADWTANVPVFVTAMV